MSTAPPLELSLLVKAQLGKATPYALEDLRTGKARLDIVSTPEPAANEGGSIASTSVDEDGNPGRVFDDMGDF